MELGWLLRGLRTGIVTTPYPARPDPPPDGFRGHPTLNAHRCTAAAGCSRCVEACLPRALRLEDELSSGQQRLVLDLLPCIACGLCVEACPEGALTMRRDVDTAVRGPSDAQTVVAIGRAAR